MFAVNIYEPAERSARLTAEPYPLLYMKLSENREDENA